MKTEDSHCSGGHPGLSCLHHPQYHIVFSKKLSDEEWGKYAKAFDSQCWNPTDWNIECLIAVAETLLNVKPVLIEFPRDNNEG